MIPGRALHRLSKALLPLRVCDQIIDAHLADFQHEWTQSTSALARTFILTRGYSAFFLIFVTCVVGLRGIATEERRALRRVFAIAVVGTFAATVGLAIAFLGNLTLPVYVESARLLEVRQFRLVLFFNMASEMLPLAVAVGLVCGIAMGLPREASPATRRAMLMVAVGGSAVVFAMSSWIPSPRFSRAFSGDSRAALRRLACGLQLGDTRQWMVAIERTRTAGPGSIRGAEVHYLLRWSLPFATFALGFFALSLSRRGRTVRIGVGLAACGAYFYLMRDVGNDLVWTSHLAPMLVAWLPNLVFIALALMVMTLSTLPTVKRL